MRSSTLSRTPAPLERSPATFTPPLVQVPTIRLTTATPSASGTCSATRPTTTILAPKAESETRKRLVPKKSKLNLLGGAKKERGKDLSDVARRVGVPSPAPRSFEIYVDPADDPDIGEIVVLRKKKSRVGLNELHWGALDDVTNTGKERSSDGKGEMTKTDRPTPAQALFKGKDDEKEKEKRWTIRGRKDSKGTQKEKIRMKSKERLKETTKEVRKSSTNGSTKEPAKTRKPPPFEQWKNSDCRQRSTSLDAGMVFGSTLPPINTNFISVPMPNDDEVTPRRGHVRSVTSPSLYSERPATLQGIAAVTQPSKSEHKPRNGSIALRAIRSVRSLARIGSWAQPKSMSTDGEDEDREQAAKKLKDKTEKKEKRKKERTTSMRSSRSSFEALKNTFGSIRSRALSGTIRSVSSEATIVSTSSDATVRHSRRVSGASIASTVRYDSPRTAVAESIISRAPKSSGASTIRWEDQVDTVKERHTSTSPKGAKRSTGSKRSSPDGRKRPGLASLFPDLMPNTYDKDAVDRPSQRIDAACPEQESETSTTLLDMNGDTSLDSPASRVRSRPLSEQMLSRKRPKGVIGDKETGAIRILDDATTDLACLIDRLDLEATPTSSPVDETPKASLIARSQVNSVNAENPVNKPSRQLSMEKLLGSLRTYKNRVRATSTSAANALGQRIAPWPESDPSEQSDPPPTCRYEETVYRSSTLPPALYEAPPVVHPLPAPSRPVSIGSLNKHYDETHLLEAESALPASFATFGKKRSSGTEGSATPTKMNGRRSRGGHGSSASQNTLVMESVDDVLSDAKARLARAKRGTLGSVGSQSASFDAEDPDFDIPRELRVLLKRNSERDAPNSTTVGYRGKRSSASSNLPPSPGTPPRAPLPPVQSPESVFQAQMSSELSDFNDDAFIASSYDDENDTKRSFDFTAELRRLGCSEASDNKSFVMQLDEAFKTPRKYSIRGLGKTLGFSAMGSPDVSTVPEERSIDAHEIALPESPTPSVAASEGDFIESSLSEPSLDRTYDEDICIKQPIQTATRTVFSKPSHGRLDMSFKFGGDTSRRSAVTGSCKVSATRFDGGLRQSPDSCKQSSSPSGSADFEKPREMTDLLVPLAGSGRNSPSPRYSVDSVAPCKPTTLSEIIPPPEHESRRRSYCSSLTEEESAVLRSILEAAASTSSVSLSMDSERVTASDARQRAFDHLVAHSRRDSDISFSGLSAYSEIRRGFEFGPSRPAFYPQPGPGASSSLMVPNAAWRNSILSLGSVSSYGRVVRDGAKDPFDFPVPARRISEDMSYTVEDTFSFLKQDPMRQRVDSGASKYSFESQYSHIRPDVHQRRNRRQVESIISIMSGPPISLYNRPFNAGRASVTWGQRNSSFESVASGFSAQRLGRPGVGDKMFESACGMPLSAISASPSQVESTIDWQSEYDSVVDGNRDQDSLFDDTRRRSLIGSQESLFGRDFHQPGLAVPPRFRPISIYSFETQESPKRDSDTVISMLGGGFVRRRSLRSTLENSPCARMEKRHQKQYLGRVLTRIPSDDDYDYSVNGSPDKARLISRPSFTSVHGSHLDSNSLDDGSWNNSGLARKKSVVLTQASEAADNGKDAVSQKHPDASRLSAYDAHFGTDRMDMAQKGLLERRSLEDCCLSGEGEDMTNTGQSSIIVFKRPERAACKRNASTGQATTTSGADTPPLSLSRSSSQFTGSQGSIDLDRLNVLLSNSTNPADYDRAARLRRRGSGHRRRINEARVSRASSVYETIEEVPEILDTSSFTGDLPKHSLESTMTQNSSVASLNVVRWENEDVGPALRMMRELQNEARLAVDASRRQWADTAYSVDALHSFQPPNDPARWKALLEQSLSAFGPLPPELQGCDRRPRKTSRPSPYPRVRVFTRPPSAQPAPSASLPVPDIRVTSQEPQPLQRVFMNSNTSENIRRMEPVFKPMNRQKGKDMEAGTARKNALQPVFASRNSMLSTARRLVSGSTKRNAPKSPRKRKQNKENAGQGTSIRAESLRISRPRPMGRPSAIPRTIRL